MNDQYIVDLHSAAQRLEGCGAWHMASIYRGLIEERLEVLGLK